MSKLPTKPTAQVVVDTVGRIYDLINRKALRTDGVNMLCLCDEPGVDAKHFKRDVFDVHRYVKQGGRDVQVALFADVLPGDMVQRMDSMQRIPIRVVMKPSQPPE